MKLHHWITCALVLLFAVSSLAGQIRFKRGLSTTKPAAAAKGEPLFVTDTGKLFIGTSSAMVEITGQRGYSGARGYDGRTIPIIYCNISGPRSYTWDQVGLNPVPAASAVKAQFWVNGVRATPLRYSWQAQGQAIGNGTASSFTPTLLSTYSANRSSLLALQATYSATAGYGGKRVCKSITPIAAVKTGATGERGLPGQDAVVTEASVLAAFAPPVSWSDNALILGAVGAGITKFEIRDNTNTTRLFIDSDGFLVSTDLSDNQMYFTPSYFSMLYGGSQAVYFNGETFGLYSPGANSHRIRMNMIGNYPLTIFRGNGTTPAWRNYSGGQWHGSEGFGSAGQCLQSNGTGNAKTWGTCGTGSGGSPGGTVNGELQTRASATTFGSTVLLRYTAVTRSGSTVTRAGLINGGNLPLTIFNSARRVVFSIRSSGAVIIGGS